MASIQVRVVDCYVYRRQQAGVSLLLMRRSRGRPYAGAWRMVAGRIESGESAWQTALRELREETGARPLNFWAVPSTNSFYEWRHDRVNIIPAFAAEVDRDPVLNDEHDAFEWLSCEQAAERIRWPEQVRLIRLIASMVHAGIPAELLIDPTAADVP